MKEDLNASFTVLSIRRVLEDPLFNMSRDRMRRSLLGMAADPLDYGWGRGKSNLLQPN
jgi:hypothetical protein